MSHLDLKSLDYFNCNLELGICSKRLLNFWEGQWIDFDSLLDCDQEFRFKYYWKATSYRTNKEIERDKIIIGCHFKRKKEVFLLVLSTYRESCGERLNLKVTCTYFGADKHKIWKICPFLMQYINEIWGPIKINRFE